MNESRVADELARHVLGWRPAPDRYIKANRSWIPRSRFKPFDDIRDALCLADALSKQYSLTASPAGVFVAEIHVDGRIGRATAKHKARAISMAVANVLGITSNSTHTEIPSTLEPGRGAR